MEVVKHALLRDGKDPSIVDPEFDKSLQHRTLQINPSRQTIRRKKIFWSPLSDASLDDDSVWSGAGEVSFDSLRVDQEEFNSLFVYSSSPADAVFADRIATLKQKKAVHIIDAKRSMNGGIMLARTKLEPSAIAKMVANME